MLAEYFIDFVATPLVLLLNSSFRQKHSKTSSKGGIMKSTNNRKQYTILTLLAILITLVVLGAASAENLSGVMGSSSQWGSGWIDLAPPVDFLKGDRLKILIGGSAEKILVRLLPKGAPPDTSRGIIGGAIIVLKSRVVEVTLPEDRKQVVQISVHGGPNPWGKFPLGGGNGAATIESVNRVTP